MKADKETIDAKLSDLARLAEQTRALTALRDDLEQQVKTAAAAAMTEEQKRRAVQAAAGRREETRRHVAGEDRHADASRSSSCGANST